jgi:hypothetical protein
VPHRLDLLVREQVGAAAGEAVAADLAEHELPIPLHADRAGAVDGVERPDQRRPVTERGEHVGLRAADVEERIVRGIVHDDVEEPRGEVDGRTLTRAVDGDGAQAAAELLVAELLDEVRALDLPDVVTERLWRFRDAEHAERLRKRRRRRAVVIHEVAGEIHAAPGP